MLESPLSRGGRRRSDPYLLRPRTTLTRVANQGVTVSTWTAVSWDTVVLDEVGAFAIGSPTQMVTPAGYSSVEFNFYTVWSNITSAARFARIDKNGGTLEVRIHTAQNEAAQHLCSRIYPTVQGDVWTFLALSSGGSLTLSGTGFAGPSYVEAYWQ